MIRLYNENDINGVIRLWEEAFGDSENEIRFFLDGCRKPLNTLIYEIDNEIASMLFLLEGDMHFEGEDYPSYYLYAACTLKKYRGRGLMAELLSFAKETANKNGKYFICLKPAEKSLFDFYGKFGYKTAFFVKITECNTKNTSLNLSDRNVSPEYLRNSAFKEHNYFKWDRQSIEFAFLHNKFFGGITSETCKGYSLYTCDDTKTIVIHEHELEKFQDIMARDYPDVTLEHMLVDNCAMQLVKNPAQFDVILTENMFGDILSDEASMVTGSIGMLASASLNDTKFGLYEPSHGSAPDIAGQDIANPIATILSAAMMLRYTFDLDKEADAIEAAVKQVLKDGYRTIDIMSEGCTQVGCSQMGTLLTERI